MKLAPPRQTDVGGFGVVGKTAIVVGHRVNECAGRIADLRRAQVHEIAGECRLGDLDSPLGEAATKPLLATDGLGGQEITNHLMPRTLCARKCGCCTHMHDYTHECI